MRRNSRGMVPHNLDIPNSSPYINVEEAAHLLRTSPKGIYAMVERRQMPGVVRVGRRLLIHQPTLVDWLHQQGASSRKELR